MSAPRFKVLISGATGLVGRRLVESLSVPSAFNSFNPEIYTLVRGQPKKSTEIFWDPYEMRIDIRKCEDFDAVIHLAGENIGSGEGMLAFTGRWTERKKHLIMESRRRGTQLLGQAVASLVKKPKVLVSASGVGFYGANNGAKVLTEECPNGTGFLAEVSRAWEEGTHTAAAAGVRVVNLRFGPVLAPEGGMIAKLRLPFSLGLGGVIGPGSQYLSWVAIDDAVRAIEHAVKRGEVTGPVNVVAPHPVTNQEFTAALAGALNRPAFIPMPEAVVKTVFGEMGEETLLASQNASSAKLESTGFRFNHETIEDALASIL